MSITLVLGGARSGKSRLAESLAQDPKYYIATAEAFDDEMKSRIEAHKSQRGGSWQTVEAPIALASEIKRLDRPEAFILVDCITLWLSNLLLADMNWEDELEQLLGVLGSLQGEVVIVSNEVGLGIVPDNALARRFRDAQGIANQSIAEVADVVVMMIAGMDLQLKGPQQGRIGPPLG
jgi:adenosylcobinamide kinase / adenosylcobinamide-phosphate guanylyltransferase